MSNNKEKLFSEFKAPTRQEWLDKIQVDLKEPTLTSVLFGARTKVSVCNLSI